MSKNTKDFKALILAGDGINCEHETAEACKDAGFQTQIQHVNDFLLEKGKLLKQSHLLVLPGGFSFGDELGSGKILALKLKHGLGTVLDDFIASNGFVLGICNGFQVLAQLGIFGKNVALTHNLQGHFQNRWVQLKIIGKCVFTEKLLREGKNSLELPIRHGEGRLIFTDDRIAQQMASEGRCILQYTENVNGSWNNTAALSAHDGRVLGLMPHPEAFWCRELHPTGSLDVPLGVELLRSAFEFLRR